MAIFLTKLKNLYISTRGFHTKRRLLLIESDDWGSIRTSSKESLVDLERKGQGETKDAFLRNDCLENEQDLKRLFDVLGSVKDSLGNVATVTANFAMANPNFQKIDVSSDKYYYEPFVETYEKYYPNNYILQTIKEGISQGVFCPQLHCREHLNVNRWMSDLKDKKTDVTTAFEYKMIGIESSFSKDNPFGYMDSFNSNFSTLTELECIFKDALIQFENTFGYKSETFVASCFVWDKRFEQILNKEKIFGIQSGAWQYVPIRRKGKVAYKRKIHYTGERNKIGQIYTIRNCSYEPAYTQKPFECAQKCLREVDNAFKFGKPAIINSHRLNYINSINPNNANNNLLGLKYLLECVVKKYKNVEFITTPKLLEIISSGENTRK